jgi:hypothetical protein
MHIACTDVDANVQAYEFSSVREQSCALQGRMTDRESAL